MCRRRPCPLDRAVVGVGAPIAAGLVVDAVLGLSGHPTASRHLGRSLAATVGVAAVFVVHCQFGRVRRLITR